MIDSDYLLATPEIYQDIKDSMMFNQISGGAVTGQIGTFMGIPVVMSNAVTSDSSILSGSFIGTNWSPNDNITRVQNIVNEYNGGNSGYEYATQNKTVLAGSVLMIGP